MNADGFLVIARANRSALRSMARDMQRGNGVGRLRDRALELGRFLRQARQGLAIGCNAAPQFLDLPFRLEDASGRRVAAARDEMSAAEDVALERCHRLHRPCAGLRCRRVGWSDPAGADGALNRPGKRSVDAQDGGNRSKLRRLWHAFRRKWMRQCFRGSVRDQESAASGRGFAHEPESRFGMK